MPLIKNNLYIKMPIKKLHVCVCAVSPKSNATHSQFVF